MSEDSWQAAKLLPTSGLHDTRERRRRAGSALMAVLGAVPDFARALTQRLGAPAGPVRTFTRAEQPGGLLRVTRGHRTWTALVEVYTDAERPEPVARRGHDALVTISATGPGLAEPGGHHLTWTEVLCEALAQHEHLAVPEPGQAWLLGELIHYLRHPDSGALVPVEVSPSWQAAREALAAGTLRGTDPVAHQVALHFEELLRFAALTADAVPALSRRQLADRAAHLRAQAVRLAGRGLLTGRIRQPGRSGVVEVVADLRAGQVRCHVDVEAPREGRPSTRVSWLVRQLAQAPDTLHLECFCPQDATTGRCALLREVRANPSALIADPRREPRSFRVEADYPVGEGSFAAALLDAVPGFHRDVTRHLRAGTAPPQRARDIPDQLTSSWAATVRPATGPH
ncbi:hypothetical protein GCM10010174_41720 [Kutzneria viridogrisea]|uniref:Transcriptional regulator n=1 Tax=Kutzneria viridogrisea TaxID=47990 RepID=A0ABR6BSC4_9PSEU|nr:hypothetical protein [Kutzneria viridogrisea]